ncbi:MAG TPA: sortase [Longilinea sp.]|nr:sortase [Longilinea sp.]
MARKRTIDDLTVEELRHLLVEKRRTERQSRLDAYRRTGRVIQVEPQPEVSELDGLRTETLDYGLDLPPSRSRRRIWLDRLLFLVEFAAVIGLIIVLVNTFYGLQVINAEAASALIQPTLTPTPLIRAVVLPSGHTPPNSPGGSVFNEAEIPEHLRPMVQSLSNLPLPTASPEQAQRIQIAAINVDAPVVLGDGVEQLKKGVGQNLINPINPGQKGNLVLSAHNDIYGQIFRDLDQLKAGDEIIVYTNQRSYVYTVRETLIVKPSQVEVMDSTRDAVVTLISCYPYMVDKQRIVVIADLREQR